MLTGWFGEGVWLTCNLDGHVCHGFICLLVHPHMVILYFQDLDDALHCTELSPGKPKEVKRVFLF